MRTARLPPPFLGPDCDDATAKMHATLTLNEVYRLRAISAAPFDGAMADTLRVSNNRIGKIGHARSEVQRDVP